MDNVEGFICSVCVVCRGSFEKTLLGLSIYTKVNPSYNITIICISHLIGSNFEHNVFFS